MDRPLLQQEQAQLLSDLLKHSVGNESLEKDGTCVNFLPYTQQMELAVHQSSKHNAPALSGRRMWPLIKENTVLLGHCIDHLQHRGRTMKDEGQKAGKCVFTR